MAAPVFASTYTNPEEFLIETVGHYQGRPEWYRDHGMDRATAKAVVGKWAYYRRRGAFPYTVEGRRAGAAAIARDLGGKLTQAQAFGILANAHAYLTLHHAKKYPDAQILKWFREGADRNVGTVATAKAAKAVRTVSAAVDAVTPWWGSSKVLVPLLALGVAGYFLSGVGKLKG